MGWKGVTRNMHLLTEVDSLNKQIDSYLLLIAKKNREVTLDRMKREDDAKDAADETDKSMNDKNDDQKVNDAKAYSYQSPKKLKPFVAKDDPYLSPMSICSQSVSPRKNPKEAYADELIAKNKRYYDIMKLLRKKVDELRACRKKIVD